MSEAEFDRCEIEILIRILSKKWSARIIYILSEHGEMRFGQIRRAFENNITTKSLSDKLSALQNEDIICRKEVDGSVKEVYYKVKDKGKYVHAALKQLELSLAEQAPS